LVLLELTWLPASEVEAVIDNLFMAYLGLYPVFHAVEGLKLSILICEWAYIGLGPSMSEKRLRRRR
jgi:hypothetical protein